VYSTKPRDARCFAIDVAVPGVTCIESETCFIDTVEPSLRSASLKRTLMYCSTVLVTKCR